MRIVPEASRQTIGTNYLFSIWIPFYMKQNRDWTSTAFMYVFIQTTRLSICICCDCIFIYKTTNKTTKKTHKKKIALKFPFFQWNNSVQKKVRTKFH